MTIYSDAQSLLVYSTMACYLLTLGLWSWRLRSLGWATYAGGFVLACSGLVWRGMAIGHVPLSNMYEVMLVLGALALPMSVCCRLGLGIEGEWADVVFALIVLTPAGFVFDPTPRALPPALRSPLFVPHVLAYMLAYAVMFKAACRATGCLVSRCKTRALALDAQAARLVTLGLPLMTIGLLLGAVWGKYAWGDWWNWDPKEMWGLATWLVYAVHLHLSAGPGRHRPRLSSAAVVAGLILIIVTVVSSLLPKLAGGLHSYA